MICDEMAQAVNVWISCAAPEGDDLAALFGDCGHSCRECVAGDWKVL